MINVTVTLSVSDAIRTGLTLAHLVRDDSFHQSARDVLDRVARQLLSTATATQAEVEPGVPVMTTPVEREQP